MITADEKRYLSENLNSEIVRVVKKAILSLKDARYNTLLACNKEDLLLVQGELRGLQSVLNLFEVISEQIKEESRVSKVSSRPVRPIRGLPSSQD